MATLNKIAKDLANTDFLQELLEGYVAQGFGQLPSRQTQLLFLELLIKHYPDWNKDKPMWHMSRTLRVSPRRLRGLLDDLNYMDPNRGDDWCRDELLTYLKEEPEIVKSGSAVSLQIDDGLVRDYAISLVRQRYGIVNFGLNSAVIELSGGQFAALVVSLIEDEGEAQKLLDQVPKDKRLEAGEEQNKSLRRQFIEAFVKGAGDEAGKKSVQLGFAYLSGGITAAVDVVQGVFGPSGD